MLKKLGYLFFSYYNFIKLFINIESFKSLNKADSDMSFINKTNQNQHVQSFQKMTMYADKFQGSLRAMGPDSQLKMTTLNSSQNNKTSFQPKMNPINSIKNNQTTMLNPNSSIYTPTNMGLWDVMKSTNSSSSSTNKNEFDFDSLNHHQTGIQQQLMKLSEKKVEVTDTFSLFAPTPQSNVSSSTPNSVSPPPFVSADKSLRAQLLAQNFNPKLVDDVLNKYKGESDIDKLIFLARGISFSSDF
jgi:hypothetical protein